jgi:hypothetical protein
MCAPFPQPRRSGAKQIPEEENIALRETVAILPYTDNFYGNRIVDGRGEKKREIRIDALAATVLSGNSWRAVSV